MESNDEIFAMLAGRTDFEPANHGSINLLTPRTSAAKDWLRANVVISEETQFWGDAVVLEPRYVEAIAHGILNGGLSITYRRAPTQH